MKSNVCVWIDQKNAFIVFWGGDIKQLDSEAASGDRSYSSEYWAQQREANKEIRNTQGENSLNQYYDEVAAQISQAESVFIFGMAEAKRQLKSRLEKKLQNRDVHSLSEAV